MKSQKAIWNKEYRTKGIRWNLETKSLPKILKGKSVLEIGVGNGKTLLAILKQKPKKITAIDFSSEAIELCRQKFANLQILFKQADTTKLPFQDNEFDVVVAYYVFNNLEAKERRIAAEEVYRVLNKNGVLIFEDFAVGDFRGNVADKKHEKIKKNLIFCHFFNKAELSEMFKKFSDNKIQIKVSRPITHRADLTRKIISGIIKK